jgi:putative addiction module component (TIGR02574 family)
MDATAIRNVIHQYIDDADDRFLSLIYGMIKADKEDTSINEISDEEMQLIEDRLAEYKKNPNSGSSWEEVEKRIKG